MSASVVRLVYVTRATDLKLCCELLCIVEHETVDPVLYKLVETDTNHVSMEREDAAAINPPTKP